MKVMLRVPTRGHPHVASAAALSWLQKNTDWDADWHQNKFCVALARNEIVAEARKKQPDFLIMFDDDVAPPHSVLELPKRNKPVIVGPVLTWKFGRFFFTCHELNEDEEFLSIDKFLPEPMEIYAAGAALMCIRKDVFNLEGPLFELRLNPDGTLLPFGGEDINFCCKMQERGVPIYADSACMAEHLTEVESLKTVNEANRYASSDSYSRMSSCFVVNTRELPFDLPKDAYMRRRRERLGRIEGVTQAVQGRPAVLAG
jgi:hypothetical protein